MITMILDGYNVIHAVPQLARHVDRSLQAGREALVGFCQAYRTRRGDIGQFYVVFDGRDPQAFGAPQPPQGGVTVVFAQKPEEADGRILRVIEAQKSRTRCVVVSNDNEVCNNARAFRASVMSVQEFYKKARPVSASAPSPAAGVGKAALSPGDAQQITEAYRKHLERK